MPWIFRDTWSYLATGLIPPPPTISAKCQLMRDHFHNMCHYRNERAAVLEFRKRVSWYAKQMNPCGILRNRMLLINSAADFEERRRGVSGLAAQMGRNRSRGVSNGSKTGRRFTPPSFA